MARFLSRLSLNGLVVLGALMLSTTATAATDGTLGLTSTGTTDISIIKGDTAQITGLADMVMAPWTTGDPAPVDSTTACVYTSTGAYQVTPTSANGAGAQFRMADGGNFLVYDVNWNDGSGNVNLNNGAVRGPDQGYASRFDKSRESATPGHYSTFLTDYGVEVDLSATARAGLQHDESRKVVGFATDSVGDPGTH